MNIYILVFCKCLKCLLFLVYICVSYLLIRKKEFFKLIMGGGGLIELFNMLLIMFFFVCIFIYMYVVFNLF